MKTVASAIRTTRATVCTALLLMIAAPHALAGEPINKRAAAPANGSVEISNTAGHVQVTGWDRNEVEVTGTLGKGADHLEFTSTGSVTRVQVVLPSKAWHVEDSDLEVKIPLGSRLQVNTVSADIRAQGVQGAQRLQSVSANITTETAGDDVECKTVSGNVTVNGSGHKGLLTITTVSGDAVLNRVEGEVNVNTVSGNVTVGAGAMSRSRLRSTSGDLAVSSQLAADARYDVESISGGVRLELAGPVSAEFDLSSFNGEIRSCFGPKAVRTSEYAPGKELRFTEGRGEARVRIRTMNGNISLCKK
ncbi:MAG TPA: DUF4097 family beta strand repeat-containing protein [Steroidobacteraceae bacterium]|nr:DUF4097 family beta strand repeat-containing protein [Steroidobacteraceae bacterium]